MEKLRKLIKEAVTEVLAERYRDSATPINTKGRQFASLGINPLTVDNGNHTPSDVLALPSIIDDNGQNFTTRGNDIVISNNKYQIYKIKNFGNTDINCTLSLFGNTKELRRAIDTINGAARRNGKNVIYRSIASESTKSTRGYSVFNSFWEFSFDNGGTWFILKPKPIQNMKISTLVIK